MDFASSALVMRLRMVESSTAHIRRSLMVEYAVAGNVRLGQYIGILQRSECAQRFETKAGNKVAAAN